jgi:hypothetical protein
MLYGHVHINMDKDTDTYIGTYMDMGKETDMDLITAMTTRT